jgi:hypothetical protein
MLELDGRCIGVDIIIRVTFIYRDMKKWKENGGRDEFCVFVLFNVELCIDNVGIACMLFCFVVLN